jgi:ABC-type lipoprotein export system ATPase subunit
MRHMNKQAMKDSIETILNLIGLTTDRNTLSKDLSGGMKRRLSIGISLIDDPKVCQIEISLIDFNSIFSRLLFLMNQPAALVRAFHNYIIEKYILLNLKIRIIVVSFGLL